MAVVVQKFGGTSVGSTERIKHVAGLIESTIKKGDQVVVVVSAMSGHTNQLVQWTKDLTHTPDLAEYDAVIASGEQITAGLLALALQERGLKARSFQGWQLGILTDDGHSNALIHEIDLKPIKVSLKKGEIPVITGFQGINQQGRITTLGRGGSDTSAVAIAAAIKAGRCDIYTDVDGIYSADPRLVPKAKKLKTISFEEMLEMASLGAKVLHTRSVALAMKENVKLQVLSSFKKGTGTMVTQNEYHLERTIINGITHNKDVAKIMLVGVADRPGIAADIFELLSKSEVTADMILQNISHDGKSTDLTFTLPKSEAGRVKKLLEKSKTKLTFKKMIVDESVAKVSVTGVGFRYDPDIPAKLFKTLSSRKINIQAIATSEVRISVLIHEKHLATAVKSLHSAFKLD